MDRNWISGDGSGGSEVGEEKEKRITKGQEEILRVRSRFIIIILIVVVISGLGVCVCV